MIFRRKNGVDREVVLRYNELGVSYGASINITILEFRRNGVDIKVFEVNTINITILEFRLNKLKQTLVGTASY